MWKLQQLFAIIALIIILPTSVYNIQQGKVSKSVNSWLPDFFCNSLRSYAEMGII